MTTTTNRGRALAAALAAAGLLAMSACSSSTDTATAGSSTTAGTAPGTTAGTTSGSGAPGTTTAPKDPADVTLDAATTAQLDELFAATFEETGLPGATARPA